MTKYILTLQRNEAKVLELIDKIIEKKKQENIKAQLFKRYTLITDMRFSDGEMYHILYLRENAKWNELPRGYKWRTTTYIDNEIMIKDPDNKFVPVSKSMETLCMFISSNYVPYDIIDDEQGKLKEMYLSGRRFEDNVILF